MHMLTCQCLKCRPGSESAFEVLEFSLSPRIGEYQQEEADSYDNDLDSQDGRPGGRWIRRSKQIVVLLT